MGALGSGAAMLIQSTPAQLAADTAPSSESDPSTRSPIAVPVQLLSWHLWASSGVTAPQLRAPGLMLLSVSRRITFEGRAGGGSCALLSHS